MFVAHLNSVSSVLESGTECITRLSRGVVMEHPLRVVFEQPVVLLHVDRWLRGQLTPAVEAAGAVLGLSAGSS